MKAAGALQPVRGPAAFIMHYGKVHTGLISVGVDRACAWIQGFERTTLLSAIGRRFKKRWAITAS